MDRRIGFFAACAVICFVMSRFAEAKFRGVIVGLAILYAVLALLFGLEGWSKARTRPPLPGGERARGGR